MTAQEIYPPEVKDFVYITDNAYTKDEILNFEAATFLDRTCPQDQLVEKQTFFELHLRLQCFGHLILNSVASCPVNDISYQICLVHFVQIQSFLTSCLSFRFCTSLGPTAAHFLDRFLRVNQCPEDAACTTGPGVSFWYEIPQEQSHLMHYLAELALLEVQMLQYSRRT